MDGSSHAHRDDDRQEPTDTKMHFASAPGTIHVGPRRIVTAPAPLQTSLHSQPTTTTPIASSGGIETLYSHPSVKITAFTSGPSSLAISPGRSVSSPIEVEPGTLPWSSQLERTIAVGPFRIYRAPGSVAFLNCGSALQPILPKSQCWCIDECSSKFVLQIRRPQYWRIEIATDAQKAQALRDVFDKVLQFEKTPCPFQRAFTVQLPERPHTPVKKRPWTPVQRKPSIQFPPTPVTPEAEPPIALMGTRGNTFSKKTARVPAENAATPALPAIQKIRRRKSVTMPSDGSDGTLTPTSTLTPNLTPRLTPTLPAIQKIKMDAASLCAERSESEPPATAVSTDGGQPGTEISAITRQHPGFQASRSVVAPPHLSLAVPSSRSCIETCSQAPFDIEEIQDQGSGTNSPTDSSASFHSLQSWHSPPATLPPSPPISRSSSPTTFPYPHENIPLPLSSLPGLDDNGPLTAFRRNFEVASVGPAGVDDVSEIRKDPVHQEKPLSVSSDCVSETSVSQASSSEDASLDPQTPATSNSVSTELSRRPRIRNRATTGSISVSRALSPLPPAANLFSPHSKFRAIGRPTTRLQAVSRIPGAIIHKTCEILLSPPGHLINLMLNVAARIAAGEWRGLVFGVGEAGEQIPVQWDYSDGSDAGSCAGRCWEVDDDHQDRPRSAAESSRQTPSVSHDSSAFDSGQGWEVD